MKIGYLVSQYPAYSHAFISTEIDALRRAGWDVETFSVNRPGIPDAPDTRRTVSVKGAPVLDVARSFLRIATRHPGVALRALAGGARDGLARPRPVKSTIWQCFYLVEAAFLRQRMIERGVTHLHVHFANNAADIAMAIVRLSTALGRGPLTWSLTIHGPTDFERAAEIGLTPKVATSSFTTCISSYGRTTAQGLLPPALWNKLHIVRMGIDRTATPQRQLASPDRQRDDGSFRLLFVGRLVGKKAPELVLEAAGEFAGSNPATSVAVTLVGDGPLAEALKEASRTLPPNVAVTFTGALGHAAVLEWYHWADVFVLPSYSEGLPVVLMEALDAGLPVITTPIAGIPELVEDGGTGRLVPTGSAMAVASALTDLARDRALRARLGEAGRERVRLLHNADDSGRVLAELFRAVSKPS